MSYATLEQTLADSGYGVSFVLSDFHTYYRGDFNKTQLRDVITLDSPLVLKISETEVAGPDGAAVGRAFTPEWTERFAVEDLEKLDEWTSHFDDFTIAKSLREKDLDDPHRKLIALTSYAVAVTFDGTPYEYRAAFKWIKGEGKLVEFFIEDYVTPAVDQALVASGEVAPLSVLQNRSFNSGRSASAGGEN